MAKLDFRRTSKEEEVFGVGKAEPCGEAAEAVPAAVALASELRQRDNCGALYTGDPLVKKFRF